MTGLNFSAWCEKDTEEVNGHELQLLNAKDTTLKVAVWALVETLPGHYVAPHRIASMLEKFGKEKAAAYIRSKLPETKRGRSADLGEILSTEYIDAHTDFDAPIKRLRWRDHREMAMRGDDVIGIRVPDEGSPRFLKVEVKSRASLNTATVHQARAALDTYGGLPSPHALGFVAERLHETGNEELGDIIDESQLKTPLTAEQVEHLLFTFSGNEPKKVLTKHLQAYKGKISQHSVGLRIKAHQKFIAEVYDNVGNDDDT